MMKPSYPSPRSKMLSYQTRDNRVVMGGDMMGARMLSGSQSSLRGSHQNLYIPEDDGYPYNAPYQEQVHGMSHQGSNGSFHAPPFIPPREYSVDDFDITGLNMNEINQKIIELLEENNLLRISMQGEMGMRQKLEQRNEELNEKLIEAKKGLQETRNALLKVQQTTEMMVARRDEREQQLAKVVMLSKNYEHRISELEAQAMKAEDAARLQTLLSNAKMTIIEKEDTISELQRQCNRFQQQISSMRSEIKDLMDSKFDLETKLSHSNERARDLERNWRLEQDRVTLLQEHDEKSRRLLPQFSQSLGAGGRTLYGTPPDDSTSGRHSAGTEDSSSYSLDSHPKSKAITQSINKSLNHLSNMVGGMIESNHPQGPPSSSATTVEMAPTAKETIQSLPIVTQINSAILEMNHKNYPPSQSTPAVGGGGSSLAEAMPPISSAKPMPSTHEARRDAPAGAEASTVRAPQLMQRPPPSMTRPAGQPAHVSDPEPEPQYYTAEQEREVFGAISTPFSPAPSSSSYTSLSSTPQPYSSPLRIASTPSTPAMAPSHSTSAPATYTQPYHPPPSTTTSSTPVTPAPSSSLYTQSPAPANTVQTVQLDATMMEQLKQFIAAHVSKSMLDASARSNTAKPVETIPGPPLDSPPSEAAPAILSPSSILRKSITRPAPGSSPDTPSTRVSFSLDRNRVKYIPHADEAERQARTLRPRTGSNDLSTTATSGASSTETTTSSHSKSRSRRHSGGEEMTTTDEEVQKAVSLAVQALGGPDPPALVQTAPAASSAPPSSTSTAAMSSPRSALKKKHESQSSSSTAVATTSQPSSSGGEGGAARPVPSLASTAVGSQEAADTPPTEEAPERKKSKRFQAATTAVTLANAAAKVSRRHSRSRSEEAVSEEREAAPAGTSDTEGGGGGESSPEKSSRRKSRHRSHHEEAHAGEASAEPSATSSTERTPAAASSSSSAAVETTEETSISESGEKRSRRRSKHRSTSGENDDDRGESRAPSTTEPSPSSGEPVGETSTPAPLSRRRSKKSLDDKEREGVDETSASEAESPSKPSRRKSRREKEERDKERSSEEGRAGGESASEVESPDKPSRRKSRRDKDKDRDREREAGEESDAVTVDSEASPRSSHEPGKLTKKRSKKHLDEDTPAEPETSPQEKPSRRKSRRDRHDGEKEQEEEAPAAVAPRAAPPGMAVLETVHETRQEREEDTGSNRTLAAQIHTIKDEIGVLVNTYRSYKAQVKTFNDDFLKQYGRPPNKEDRRALGKEIFKRYNLCLRDLKQKMSDLEQIQQIYTGVSESAKAPLTFAMLSSGPTSKSFMAVDTEGDD